MHDKGVEIDWKFDEFIERTKEFDTGIIETLLKTTLHKYDEVY